MERERGIFFKDVNTCLVLIRPLNIKIIIGLVTQLTPPSAPLLDMQFHPNPFLLKFNDPLIKVKMAI